MSDAGSEKGAYVMPHRPLGTCPDCYTWWGPRGSAHDPARCQFLDSEIARLEHQIASMQHRLDSHRITRGNGEYTET